MIGKPRLQSASRRIATFTCVLAALAGAACDRRAVPGHVPASAVDATHLSSRLDALAAAIDSARQRFHVPGAAVVILRGDSVVFTRGFGRRDVARNLPVTPKTLFAIGSCTKPFTVLATLISADHGLLSLDDSPRRFLPYFHLREREADSLVTFRDLLSHRTGVPDDLGGGWFERYGTRENLIRAAMARGPQGRFRQVFHYNNYMVLAAGEAVAVANHVTYEALVQRALLDPIGMHASSLSLEHMEASPDFAYGYEDSGRVVVRPTRLAYNVAIAPAANINSNAEDMGQWLRVLVGGGVIDGQRIVSATGIQEMLEPQVATAGGHYALGWFAESWHGARLYSAPGGVAGYGTRCEFLPDQRLGWVVLTNVDDQALPKAIREAIYTTLVQ